MASSVTPQRRRREQDESPDTSSPNSKRQRTDNEEEDDDNADGSQACYSHTCQHQLTDQEQSSQRPVLPDNYRRSPKGKGRARGDATRDKAQEHQPGSIVRVKLTNFVTYTKAEFHPGPNLNMVIGPNGTGKSTLVCAICLGLGWPPIHLGRAKDINEFVKHGAKKASIEIELKADPKRHSHNPIITTIIPKDGGKSAESKTQFLIDGKKSTKKAVMDLARSFFIQVDNLCQFLPQDRVVEFAALSSVALLVETQRAAAPEQMTIWHEELKAMRKQEKEKQAEQQGGMEQLKNLEDRQKSQEVDVERMRKRTDLQQKLSNLQKMKPFPAYLEAKNAHAEARKRKKVAAKELKSLERRMEPRLEAVKAKKVYQTQLDGHISYRKKLLDRFEMEVQTKLKKIGETQAKVDGCDKEIKAEKEGGTKAKADIGKHKMEMRRIEALMKTPPPEFNSAEMNAEIKEKKQQKRAIDDSVADINESISVLQVQGKQRSQMKQQQQRVQESLQSQAGRQANKLESISRNTAQAWDWIQANRASFESPVYGPPMIECSLKDARYADAVEMVVGQSELKAITVTSDHDYRMLNKQLSDTMGLTEFWIRAVHRPLSYFSPSISKEELGRLGFECFVLDLIDGPDDVLAMLCDNRNIHQAVYTSRDIPNNRFDTLENSTVSTAVSSKQIFNITRRREYGADGISSRANNLRPAQLLTDQPVDTEAERASTRAMNVLEDEINQIKEEITGEHGRRTKLLQDAKKLDEEIKALESDKNDKQSQNTQFNGLGTKLENIKLKLENVQADDANRSKRIAEIVERSHKHSQEMGQQALDYSKAVEQLQDLCKKLVEFEIMSIEAKSDAEQLEAQHKDEQEALDARQREVDGLEVEVAQLLERGRKLQDHCNRISREFSAEESTFLEGIAEWLPPQLETEIQATEAELGSLHGGNENIIREFEQRAKKIEDKRAALQGLETSLAGLAANITEIRNEWEPRLDQLVAEISEAFAENFSQIQCAGEVGVDKHEDFEQWKIQIKVKFRYGLPHRKEIIG